MLREQVITPRGGKRAGQGRGRTGGVVQKPAARRGAAPRASARSSVWHTAVVWLPTFGKVLLAVCAGVFAFHLYRTAAASAFFTLRTVDVSGASRASTEQLEKIVRRAAAPVGVWRAD